MLCPRMKETKNTEVDSAFFAICPVVDPGILMAHNRMKIPAHLIFRSTVSEGFPVARGLC